MAGILSILFGIFEMGISTGSYAHTENYGEDVCTGIRHATGNTENNVQNLSEICKFGIGALLISFGWQ